MNFFFFFFLVSNLGCTNDKTDIQEGKRCHMCHSEEELILLDVEHIISQIKGGFSVPNKSPGQAHGGHGQVLCH